MSLCAPHAEYYNEIIEIPSLHIYGQNDKVIPTGNIICFSFLYRIVIFYYKATLVLFCYRYGRKSM